MKTITIAIAEDHVLIRQALRTMLEKEHEINVLFDVGNGKELLEQLKGELPQILILDIQMPVMDGAEVYEIIKLKYPNIKVIILSMHYNEAYVSKFVMAGVVGFLPKNCDFDQLLNTIYSVHEHGYYVDASMNTLSYNSYKIALPNGSKKLSERQISIIRLLYLEKNVEEISKLLFLSKRTVEWHKNQIFEKTETKSVVGLLKYAISSGIITMP
jgi:DNA-binding NarL/FixJ family response regulator